MVINKIRAAKRRTGDERVPGASMPQYMDAPICPRAFPVISRPRTYETGRRNALPRKTKGDRPKSTNTPVTSPVSQTEKLNVGSGTHGYDSRNDSTIELYNGRKPVSASSVTCRAMASARQTQAIPHCLVRLVIVINLSGRLIVIVRHQQLACKKEESIYRHKKTLL